jgi:2OG-Fe(II) oxygenase superfamily
MNSVLDEFHKSSKLFHMFNLEKEIGLYYRNGDKSLIRINENTCRNISVHPDIIKDSSFGNILQKSNEYNTNVRVSREISADHLFIDETDSGERIVHIDKTDLLFYLNEQIKNIIGRKVTTAPYKLIAYQKGSFFKEHVDSLKSPNNIGTLLIGLYDNYEGGNLVIWQHYKKESIKICKNNCIFMYGSCPHEIEKITEGTRVVLAFDVFVNEESDGEESDGEESDPIHTILSDIKKNSGNKTYVAIPLEFKYSIGRMAAYNDINTEYSGKCLKENDMRMYKLFSKFVDTNIVAFYKLESDSGTDFTTDFNYCMTIVNGHEIYGHDVYVVGGKENIRFQSESNETDDPDKEYYTGNDYCYSYYHYGCVCLLVKSKDLQ